MINDLSKVDKKSKALRKIKPNETFFEETWRIGRIRHKT